jgi:Predicted membrane-associated Zn-dependent proteases 1
VSWVLVFAGFAALIMLHEFGHFIVAKATGMRVERFFLFFPPKLVSIKRGETEYGIGMIPLGGFVKITGMNPAELEPAEPDAAPREAGLLERVESVDQPEGPGVSRPGERLSPELMERAYYNQPVWKRIVVIAAGPLMNVLIAFVVLFALSVTAQKPVGSDLEVGALQSGAAATGKLKPGDRIISIDGVTGNNLSADGRATKFRDLTGMHKCAGTPTDGCLATTPVHVVVQRGGRQVPVDIVPKYEADQAQPQALLGVQFQAVHTEPVPAGEAAGNALDDMWYVTSRSLSTFARLFESKERKQVHSVVGVSDVAHQTIESSGRQALALLAIVSLSLAIINLFPFLPLDGGHIFWSLVEKFRGERVPFSVIERASVVGFLLVIMLFVIGLSNDIGRLTG